MAKNNTSDKEQPSPDSSQKLEAIKNLIFGENIAEYNYEFDHLKKDLAKKREELQNFIEETRSELMQSIDSLSTDINIRITDLENNLQDKTDKIGEDKVDRKILGKLLVTMGEKIMSK